jgi:hypothetical protein
MIRPTGWERREQLSATRLHTTALRTLTPPPLGDGSVNMEGQVDAASTLISCWHDEGRDGQQQRARSDRLNQISAPCGGQRPK